jgi:nitroimidazol reductase NimA-like FMN-containing flavoprotein (pyridoxamine 5'-phosphate oxidase superfamily)
MLGKLNDFQIDRILLSQTCAHLGCHAEGRTYVVPVSYVFEENFLYGHTIEGLKIDMMRKNPEVCVQVELIENHAHWQSVIVWGTYEELQGREADHAIQLLTSRLHPFITSQTTRPAHSMQQMHSTAESGRKTVAFRIRILEKTGRFERQ